MQLPFPAAAVSTVLHGIYSQQLDLQDAQLLGVLAVADFLGVATQKEACCKVPQSCTSWHACMRHAHAQHLRMQVLHGQLSPLNCIAMMAAADQYSCPQLYEEAVRGGPCCCALTMQVGCHSRCWGAGSTDQDPL